MIEKGVTELKKIGVNIDIEWDAEKREGRGLKSKTWPNTVSQSKNQTDHVENQWGDLRKKYWFY